MSYPPRIIARMNMTSCSKKPNAAKVRGSSSRGISASSSPIRSVFARRRSIRILHLDTFGHAWTRSDTIKNLFFSAPWQFQRLIVGRPCLVILQPYTLCTHWYTLVHDKKNFPKGGAAAVALPKSFHKAVFADFSPFKRSAAKPI
jgi:hypothetical protein